MTRASIVNIEGGRQRPPLHVLWQIAASLDVGLHQLIPSTEELATTGDPVHLEPQIVASIEKAAQNNPAAKKLLSDFIRKATSTIEAQSATRQEKR